MFSKDNCFMTSIHIKLNIKQNELSNIARCNWVMNSSNRLTVCILDIIPIMITIKSKRILDRRVWRNGAYCVTFAYSKSTCQRREWNSWLLNGNVRKRERIVRICVNTRWMAPPSPCWKCLPEFCKLLHSLYLDIINNSTVYLDIIGIPIWQYWHTCFGC